MSENNEELTLNVSHMHGGTTSTHNISGDANFIWEEVGILLADPSLRGFSLQRSPA